MVGTEGVLHWAVAVIVTGASLMFLLVLAHGYKDQRDHARYDRIAAPLQGRLLQAIQHGRDEPALVSEIARLSLRHRTRLLVHAGRIVRGEEKRRVTRFAERLGVLRHAGRRTRSPYWWRRLAAVRVFIATGGGENEVPSLLADSHTLVRSEAASWCADHPEPENIRRLLNLMDTPTLADRIAVIDALVSIGPKAVEPLADRLRSCTKEGRKTALIAALGLADPAFLPAALSAVEDADAAVRTQAARLLSILGSETAVTTLEALLEDEDPTVRAAAARGLGRLGAWSAAGSLERLMSDAQSDPRRDAALALADLGAPGWILLRETVRSGGPAGRLADAVLESLWAHGPQEERLPDPGRAAA